MDSVNEKSTAYITVSFFDKNKAPIAPDSITYNTLDVLTGAMIKTSITVTPAASVVITLDAADSAISNISRAYENKCLVVKSVYGVEQCNDEYFWSVKNLNVVA